MTPKPSNEYQKLAEAVALLERQLPELDVAAIPTKSEVFTACGGHARALHDAIATVLSALKLPHAGDEGGVQDWWNPDPEDPFWMLENDKAEWLKNEHSCLFTRDPAKALRFPSEEAADRTRRHLHHPFSITLKPTEHAWIRFTPPAGVSDNG